MKRPPREDNDNRAPSDKELDSKMKYGEKKGDDLASDRGTRK